MCSDARHFSEKLRYEAASSMLAISSTEQEDDVLSAWGLEDSDSKNDAEISGKYNEGLLTWTLMAA